MDPSEGRFYREAFPSLCDFYLQADHCETSFNLFLFLPLEDFSRFLPPCEDFQPTIPYVGSKTLSQFPNFLSEEGESLITRVGIF